MTPPTRRRTLALACAFLALAACSSIPVDVREGAGDLAASRTYAWSPPPAAGALVDAAQVELLRTAVEGELAARGLRQVSSTDADLLVRAELGIEFQVTSRHAYNTGFWTADRFEDGVLSVELLEAGSQTLAWGASAKQRLRREAKGYGLYQLNWVETDEARDWRLDEVVAAIFRRFPLERALPESD